MTMLTFRLITLSVCLCTIKTADMAKILLVAMPQGRSHVMTFLPFLHRLVAAGHNVTVYFDIYKPELPLEGGINEYLIRLNENDHSPDGNRKFHEVVWSGSMRGLDILIPFHQGSVSCKQVQESQPDKFAQLMNTRWDMVLVDTLFSPCGYGLALHNKKPYISMHSADIDGVLSYLKGYARNYGIIPKYFLDYEYAGYDHRKFLDRVSGIGQFVELFLLMIGPINWMMQWAASSIVPNFTTSSFASGSAFAYYDFPDHIAWPAPLVNDAHSYGAFCKPSKKPLGGLIGDMVSDAKSKGTILISMGTICRWDLAPAHVIEAFVNALNQLSDYRVIWAYKGPPLALKSHIVTDEWVPQNEILNHFNTKLFVSHGGMKSLREAICSETPVVYMPMFAEQLRNSFLSRQLHFAEYVNKHNLTALYLLETMKKVLNDDSYKRAVVRTRFRMLDQPIAAMDKAVHHFRKLAQYGGRMPHFFYRKALFISTFSYFYLDLGSIVLVLLIVFASKC